MVSDTRVAVASKSFSRNPTLRAELASRYDRHRFNDTGAVLKGQPLIDFLRGHDKAITGLDVLDEEVFAAVPELRVVSKYGVGLDMIDLAAAKRHGVSIRWTPGVNRDAVAELTIALMISIARSVGILACEMRDGTWRQPGGRQLSSATVGIVGCGHVGQAVARLCRACGSRVIAHDICTYAEVYRDVGITAVPLDALLEQSDFVTIHVPLDRTTRGMFGAREFSRMQRTAFLINTSRGGIVDEEALKLALIDRRIAGAAFDVFAAEPPDAGAGRELLMLPNFMATPHIGAATQEAVLAMGRAAIEGLDDPTRQIVDE